MKPWDSWIDEETQKNGASDIQKTTISGNVNGAHMATPPSIRPPDFNKPEKKRTPERSA